MICDLFLSAACAAIIASRGFWCLLPAYPVTIRFCMWMGGEGITKPGEGPPLATTQKFWTWSGLDCTQVTPTSTTQKGLDFVIMGRASRIGISG